MIVLSTTDVNPPMINLPFPFHQGWCTDAAAGEPSCTWLLGGEEGGTLPCSESVGSRGLHARHLPLRTKSLVRGVKAILTSDFMCVWFPQSGHCPCLILSRERSCSVEGASVVDLVYPKSMPVAVAIFHVWWNQQHCSASIQKVMIFYEMIAKSHVWLYYH